MNTGCRFVKLRQPVFVHFIESETKVIGKLIQIVKNE